MALPDIRSAGICLHFTSLPGAYGIGSLGASAHRFIDFLAQCGMQVWQYLPPGPTAYGNSPYQPLSTYAGNPLLIDLAALVEQGLLLPGELAPLAGLPAAYVDYAAVIPAKSNLLSLAGDRFLQQASTERRLAFDAFCAANGPLWLDDFALFQALKKHHDERPWQAWEEPFRQRKRDALAEFSAGAAARIEKYKVTQFLFAEQWRQLREYAAQQRVRMFGDVPVYIALDSADAWANRRLFSLDQGGWPTEVAGVPPDYFSDQGQRWGNPVYDWPYHASTGYRWWISRMRHALEQNDIVRIDHFRGFESYWAIPADAASAQRGRWCTGPGDPIFAAMRSTLGDLPIVAEDLGIITQAVNDLRERQGFPGMKVLQFLLEDADFSLGQIPKDCVCYTGTHDNDTISGWFHGSAAELRPPAQLARLQSTVLAITGRPATTVVQDIIRLALASAAQIAIVPMQDFLGLGSGARFNTPGTTHHNWEWRLQRQALSDEFADRLGSCVSQAGRGPAAVLQSRAGPPVNPAI